MKRRYITRQYYLDRIRPFMGKDIIKVITGQRRVGKSYLLFQIMDSVLASDPEAQIIYINKELYAFDFIDNYKALLEYVHSRVKNDKTPYVFVDEIQDIDQFEKALRSLLAEGGYDLYCTGSNAGLLSGELATYLSGRSVEIKVFCLSYREFLDFHKLDDSSKAFLKYVRFGGLPYLINLRLEDDVVYDYLRNIYNTILFKDVVKRHGIRNIDFLERLATYLADNTGSLVSAKKISDFLKSQKTNISPNVVLNYLSHLESAFFVMKARRSEIGGKKIFEIGEKYYFEDLGLRHTIVGYRQSDIGRVLENLVFIHLKRSGYEVFVGRIGKKEIDFTCEKAGERIHIQVAYMLTDQKTHDREFGNLLAIKDNFTKIVVSMDEMTGATYKGIKHMNIRDFLLSEP